MIMFGGGANMLAGLTGIAESSTRLLAFAYTCRSRCWPAAAIGYWWRVDRLAAVLMLLTIAYLVVMSLGVEAYSRFRVPFLPLYAMLAGGGAAALLGRWRPVPATDTRRRSVAVVSPSKFRTMPTVDQPFGGAAVAAGWGTSASDPGGASSAREIAKISGARPQRSAIVLEV